MFDLKLYFSLAWKDVIRLWSATQLQVVIIAGICLPILLLLGLKRGHVAELREELVKSPTGRQIIFWSGNEDNFLDQAKLDELKDALSATELIIPESQRLLFFSTEIDGDAAAPVADIGVTLYSTLPGDPLLEQFGVALSESSQSEDAESESIIISQGFAEQSGLAKGDSFELLAKRRIRSEKEEHKIAFTVTGVIPSGDSSDAGSIGYASTSVLERLEAYSRGNAVPSWSIPAMDGLKAIDTYQSMLCICLREPGGVLTERDIEFLNGRGLEVHEASSETHPRFFSILAENAVESLTVFEVFQPQETEGIRSIIRDSPSFLAANTEAVDDFFLRWCQPCTYAVEGTEVELVGLTLPFGREAGGWIQDYVNDDCYWFSFDESVAEPNLVRSGAQPVRAELILDPSSGESPIPLNWSQYRTGKEAARREGVEQESKGIEPDAGLLDASSDEFLTVPVTLMAYLEQAKAGETTFDTTAGIFIELAKPITYTKARLYADSIDSVPQTVNALSENGYAVLSESSRIAEIQEQDRSLQMLVAVTAAGVFLFGVLTVFNVLVDSTDRKRGTIGVLRVMGVSKIGIFFVVLMRASMIGLLAALLCTLAGVLSGEFLSMDLGRLEYLKWKPTISVVTDLTDLFLVAGGAAFCAISGAVVPAYRASRLDPFDAIMEGRFS